MSARAFDVSSVYITKHWGKHFEIADRKQRSIITDGIFVHLSFKSIKCDQFNYIFFFVLSWNILFVPEGG